MVTRHNFENWPLKDHPCHVCFKLAYWFQRRRFLNIFPIGSYVKTMFAWPRPPSKMAAMSRHSFNIDHIYYFSYIYNHYNYQYICRKKKRCKVVLYVTPKHMVYTVKPVLGTPVSSTNKTDHHNITEILLKVALNTINHVSTNWHLQHCQFFYFSYIYNHYNYQYVCRKKKRCKVVLFVTPKHTVYTVKPVYTNK
jgi:hypothetical protein